MQGCTLRAVPTDNSDFFSVEAKDGRLSSVEIELMLLSIMNNGDFIPIGILSVGSGPIGTDVICSNEDDVGWRNSPFHADSLVGLVDDGAGLAHFNDYERIFQRYRFEVPKACACGNEIFVKIHASFEYSPTDLLQRC